MSSAVVLPKPRRRGSRLIAGSAATLCLITFAVIGGCQSVEALPDSAVNESVTTAPIGSAREFTVIEQTSTDQRSTQHRTTKSNRAAKSINTTGRDRALPLGLAAILLICIGVFVRLFVSIRNNLRRARPKIAPVTAFSRRIASTRSAEFLGGAEFSGGTESPTADLLISTDLPKSADLSKSACLTPRIPSRSETFER